MANISHFTQTVNGISTTYDIHDADAIPRSGGAVFEGYEIFKTSNTGYFAIGGGTKLGDGASVIFKGANDPLNAGTIQSIAGNGSTSKSMWLKPDGTWTWDAWEDVEPSQFKYNDAVDAKKDKARLHTGFVVQQIDSACKSHGVDISQYGLYCHEEYPQETEEVEVEQADGTKTKEKKVICEASEHYSLRYTEVYAVECMYLRRCIARLTARIEELEKGNNTK